jgi:UDP-N-acetylglucosamine:LPS N-acetylglucosamine transferase
MVPDESATTERIAGIAGRLLDDDDARAKMRAAALELGRPDAAGQVAALLKELAA